MTRTHESTVERHVLDAFAWLLGSGATTLLAQLLYTAFTSRLLDAAAFGAFALALTVVGLVALFCASGMANAVTRAEHVDRPFVSTALGLSMAVGAGGSIVLAAAALGCLAAGFRAFGLVLLVLSVQPLAAGAGAVPSALLRRSLRFRHIAVVETSAQLVGFATGAVLTLTLHAGWALGVAPALSAALISAAMWRRARPLPRPRWDPDQLRRLLGVAGQIAGQNLAHFVLYQVPLWAIGRFAGLAAVGFYNRACAFTLVPLQQVVNTLTRPLYPTYARHAGDEVALRRAVTDAVVVASGVAALVFGLVAGAADLGVAVLLGPGWDGVPRLVRTLALYAALNVVYTTAMSALEAIGLLRAVWRTQAAFAVALLAGSALAAYVAAGVQGFVVAFVAAQAVAVATAVLALDRATLLHRRESGRALAAHVLTALAITATAALAVPALLPALPAPAAQAIAVVPCAAALLLARELVPVWAVLKRFRAA